MIRLIAVAALPWPSPRRRRPCRSRRFISRMASPRKSAKHAARVGYGLMVSAWPEPPSAMSAEQVRRCSAMAWRRLRCGGTETPSDRAGEEHSGVEAALNLPGRFLQRAKFREAAAPQGG